MRLDDVLAKVQGPIQGLVTTFGSAVAPYTFTIDNDPETLAVSMTNEVVGTPVEVLLSTVTSGPEEVIPGVMAAIGDWRITAERTYQPEIGTWIKATASRETSYVGQVAKIIGVRYTGAGIVTTVYARPGRPE